jgi:hypothetical protein
MSRRPVRRAVRQRLSVGQIIGLHCPPRQIEDGTVVSIMYRIAPLAAHDPLTRPTRFISFQNVLLHLN